MKPIEEIVKNRRVKITEKHGTMFAGVIQFPRYMASLVVGYDEDGFEHVSISPFKHTVTPTWDDMCELKDIFFYDEEEVMQFHPPKSEYVNIMPNCLHLWRWKGKVPWRD